MHSRKRQLTISDKPARVGKLTMGYYGRARGVDMEVWNITRSPDTPYVVRLCLN